MRRFGPALLSLAFFGLYAATCATTVQGGDSGQFTLLAALGGIAHPPGYPVHTLLLMAVGQLPVNPAWSSALLSAALGATTLGVVAQALRRRHGEVPALAAAAALGCAPTFWHYSVVAEVFSGAALSFALVLLVASRIAEGARGPRWQLALGLAVAAGVAHHHVIVFLTPLAVWAFWRAGPRHVHATVAGLLPGFLAYLTLLRPGGGWRWADPSTLEHVVEHFLRRDFGTFKLTIHDADVAWWEHPLLYLRDLPGETFVVFLAAALVGLVAALRSDRGFHLALLAAFLLSGLGFLGLFNVPAEGLGAAMAKRFHIPSLVLLAPFVAAGLACLPRHRLTPVLLVAVLCTAAMRSANLNDRRHWTVLEDYAVNALESLDERALLLGQGDSIFYAVIYAQEVLGHRPDVVFVHPRMTSWDWYRARTEALHEDFRFGEARSIPQLVNRVYLDRPIYLSHGWMSMPGVADKLPPAYPAHGVAMRLVGPGEQLPTTAAVEGEMVRTMADFQHRSKLQTEAQMASYEAQAVQQYAWSWQILASAYRADGDEAGARRCEDRAETWWPSGGE